MESKKHAKFRYFLLLFLFLLALLPHRSPYWFPNTAGIFTPQNICFCWDLPQDWLPQIPISSMPFLHSRSLLQCSFLRAVFPHHPKIVFWSLPFPFLSLIFFSEHLLLPEICIYVYIYIYNLIYLKYIYIYFFGGCTLGILKFLWQGLNLSCSCALHHSCGNARSSSHCTIVGTSGFIF